MYAHPQPFDPAIERRLPPLSRLMFAAAWVVLAWEMRRRTRRHLARLDDHLRRDVGLDAQSAASEATKPFWQA